MTEVKLAELAEPARKVAVDLRLLGAKIIAAYPPRTIVIETPSGETKSLCVSRENFADIIQAFEIGYELGRAKSSVKAGK